MRLYLKNKQIYTWTDQEWSFTYNPSADEAGRLLKFEVSLGYSDNQSEKHIHKWERGRERKRDKEGGRADHLTPNPVLILSAPGSPLTHSVTSPSVFPRLKPVPPPRSQMNRMVCSCSFRSSGEMAAVKM